MRYTWTIYNKDANGNLISSGVQLAISPTGQAYFYPINDNDILFGASTAYIKGIYTKLINSINPGSLFLPQDRSARVDISAYFTNTGNGLINRVTPPDYGYIFLSVTDVVIIHCVSQTESNLTHYAQTFSRASAGQIYCLFPVRKNDNIAVQWYTTASAVSLSAAYFIPCKGNV